MTKQNPLRFVFLGCAIALLAGIVLGAATRSFGDEAMGWALLGWVLMASVGVAGGAWAVTRHGSTGSGFIVAVGAGMLARVLLAGAGALVVASRSEGGLIAYFAGVGAGYVPVQMFEMGWFIKQGRTQA